MRSILLLDYNVLCFDKYIAVALVGSNRVNFHRAAFYLLSFSLAFRHWWLSIIYDTQAHSNRKVEPHASASSSSTPHYGGGDWIYCKELFKLVSQDLVVCFENIELQQLLGWDHTPH